MIYRPTRPPVHPSHPSNPSVPSNSGASRPRSVNPRWTPEGAVRNYPGKALVHNVEDIVVALSSRCAVAKAQRLLYSFWIKYHKRLVTPGMGNHTFRMKIWWTHLAIVIPSKNTILVDIYFISLASLGTLLASLRSAGGFAADWTSFGICFAESLRGI